MRKMTFVEYKIYRSLLKKKAIKYYKQANYRSGDAGRSITDFVTGGRISHAENMVKRIVIRMKALDRAYGVKPQ